MGEKVGRKKQFESEGWTHFSMRLPKELGRAWARYVVDVGKNRSQIVLEYLEELLGKGGYVRVITKKDPDSGKDVRSYHAVER